jgi:hypothetical protein
MLPARGRRLKMLPAKRPKAENAPGLAEEKDEEMLMKTVCARMARKF